MDLFKLPIVELSKKQKAKKFLDVFKDGEKARKASLSIDECPPYRVSSWCDIWMTGWFNEDCRIKDLDKAKED